VPVRAVVDAPLPDQLILSARVANLVIGLLLALVHYRLGRDLFGPGPAFVAASLFQLLPVPARVGADGLSDGLYLLFLGLALLAGARAVRAGSCRRFARCGLAVGAAYLVRPEGLLAAGAVGGMVIGLAVARRATASATMARLATLLCGVALLAGPYMAAVGGVTNKPTGKKLLNQLLGLPTGEVAKAGTAGPLFASWYTGAGESKQVWVVDAVQAELMKAFHYFPAGLAVIGVLAVRRRMCGPEPELFVPAALAGLNLLLLIGVAVGAGYVAERHTLPVVFVGCLFYGAAVGPVAEWFSGLPGVRRALTRRSSLVLGVAAMMIACLPATLRPLHANRAGHVAAGRWLAGHAGAHDRIVDPFGWAQFYAGRGLDRVPAENDGSVVYAVIEEGKDRPHSKVWDYDYALAVARDGKPVYQWPAAASPGATPVAVYRFERAKP
jgi:4-amino-4-deoxy-L-arabinose transferase-like glycosyltransferase